MTYGCLQNTKSAIYSKNIHLISIKLNKILSDILVEFKGHIIYIDTDKIIFRNFNEVQERFNSYFNDLNKYELTYFTEKAKIGIFIRIKKYLIEKDNNIKIKGIKYFIKDDVSRGGFINFNQN